jgi:hypothetical protein
VSNPTQDQTAILREAAVTALLAYGVVLDAVAVPVESERVDPVEDGDMPRIVIYGDDNGITASPAGTAPAFDVTCTLVVQALAQRAQRADAVTDIDALVAQIKDGLLGDPQWLQIPATIRSLRTQRTFKHEGRRVLGEARLQIECAWREIYPPRITQPLATVTLTTTPPDGTQPIESGVTIPTS